MTRCVSRPNRLISRFWCFLGLLALANLLAFMSLARLGEHVDVDLWNYETDDGRSLRTALDYLVKHADGSETWPHRDMQRPAWTRLIPSLRMAADQYQHPAYAELAERLGGDTYAENRLQLLDPRE